MAILGHMAIGPYARPISEVAASIWALPGGRNRYLGNAQIEMTWIFMGLPLDTLNRNLWEHRSATAVLINGDALDKK